MHLYRSFFVFLAFILPLSSTGQPRTAANVHAAMRAAGSVASGSVEVRQGDLHERVTALRDDIVRITMWRGNSVPEDASWAVPATVRHGSVPVSQWRDNARMALRTAVLTVEIDTKTLEITVRDRNGDIVQQ